MLSVTTPGEICYESFDRDQSFIRSSFVTSFENLDSEREEMRLPQDRHPRMALIGVPEYPYSAWIPAIKHAGMTDSSEYYALDMTYSIFSSLCWANVIS